MFRMAYVKPPTRLATGIAEAVRVDISPNLTRGDPGVERTAGVQSDRAIFTLFEPTVPLVAWTKYSQIPLYQLFIKVAGYLEDEEACRLGGFWFFLCSWVS